MPDRIPVAPDGRIAVVDVGSNSLRLVVFERLGASLVVLLNEKVMSALGRGIAVTGRLDPAGVELAFANLQRFVALARALAVDHLAIIATAAVREASDGRAFAAEIEERCGVPVRVNAKGKTPIGAAVSLPLGPLRLAEFGDNRKAVTEQIERAIATAPVLRECAGRSLYLVGGAWRAIARLHIEQMGYPLHIIHQYRIPRRPAEAFLEIVGSQSRRSLERITGISRRRLD